MNACTVTVRRFAHLQSSIKLTDAVPLTAVKHSVFDALEGLEDDASSHGFQPAHRRRARHAGALRQTQQQPPQPPQPPPQQQQQQQQQGAQHAGTASGPAECESRCPHSQPEAALSERLQQMIQKLKIKGLWDHKPFTNAMNPVTKTHDPVLRAAYALLSKPEQSLLWRMIPNSTHPHAGQRIPVPGAAQAAPHTARNTAAGHSNGSTAVPHRRSRSHAHSAASPARSEVLSLSPEDLGGHLQVSEGWLGEERTTLTEANACVVCLEQERNALLMPCRHRVLCMMCAFQVQDCSCECPYCRAHIEDIMQT